MLVLHRMASKEAGYAANGLTNRSEKESQGHRLQALPLLAVSRHVTNIATKDKEAPLLEDCMPT
jgi:hypothetical protein